MNNEEAVISAFIGKEKRDRYLGFLGNPKRRDKLRELLAHGTEGHLAAVSKKAILPREQTLEGILAMLVARGAPATCHVISEDSRIDGRDMPLREALEATVGQGMGTIISCVPGRLGYFEGEGQNVRFLLEKQPGRTRP